MNGNKVDVGEMNAWSERAVAEDASFVVDNGASSYLPMLEYLLEAEIFECLAESGKRVIVHMPVIGGRSLAHTVDALELASKSLPRCVDIVPWFNPYFGPLVADDGAELDETELYAGMADRLSGPVKLPTLHPDYAGAYFEQDARRQPDLRRRARRHRRRDDLPDVAGADLEADQRADRPGAVAMDRQTVRAALDARPDEDAVFAVCAVLETIVKAEFAKLEAARARDAATMHEVRKLLARLRPVGSVTPSWVEPAFWVVSTALVVALAALAFLLKLV